MFVPIKDLLFGTFEDFNRLFANTSPKPIPSGFKTLDMAIRGFYPGEVTVLAGADKNCLTAFCYNIALGALISEGVSVIVHTQSPVITANRLIAVGTGLPMDERFTGDIKICSRPILSIYAGQLTAANLYLTDTINNVAEEIEKRFESGSLYQKILIIDDIDTIAGDVDGGTDSADSTELKLKTLKDLAEKNHLAVIVCIGQDLICGANTSWSHHVHKLIGVTLANQLRMHDEKIMKEIQLTIHKNTTAIIGGFSMLYDPLSGKCLEMPIVDQADNWDS